jgi:hypothetical protein
MAGTIIRSLSTALADRVYVEIDGSQYGLRQPMEFELVDLNRLQRMQREVQAGIDETTTAGSAELHAMLDECARMVLIDCPDDVHARLRDMHRLAIISSFSQAAEKPEYTERATEQMTSTRGSRRSAASTEAMSTIGQG